MKDIRRKLTGMIDRLQKNPMVALLTILSTEKKRIKKKIYLLTTLGAMIKKRSLISLCFFNI